MKELIIGLDGITFQPVGELLLECGTRPEKRRECKTTYKDSLRQFALASLLGDRIAVPAKMPKVGSDYPGEDLKALLGSGMIVPVGNKTPKNWKTTLLGCPSFKEKVISWLTLLDEAHLAAKVHWDDWIVREVAAGYLGQDASLASREVQPANIKIQADHFLDHSEIQSVIPARFISSMARKLKEKFHHLGATDANVNEFVSRTAVTHVVNYWKMNLDIEDEYANKIVRLPHMTRTSIRLAELRRSEGSRQDQNRGDRTDQVIRALLPFPLLHLVRGLEKRTDLITRLMDLRDIQPFPQIRDRLRTVLGELEQNNHRGALKLCNEIEKLSKHGGGAAACEQTAVDLGVRAEQDCSLTAYVRIPVEYKLLQRWFRPDRYLLRQFTSVDDKASEHVLKKRFPEVA
jgi:hypothetical protein